MKLKLSLFFLVLTSFPVFCAPVTELTCYSTTFAPYSFVEKGVVKGANIDVIREITKKLKIKVTFKTMPWQRLLKNIAINKIACAAAFFKSSTRVDNMFFMTEPLSITDYTIFIEQSNTDKYRKLIDFKGASIGVNRGFKTTPEFESAVSQGLIKQYEVGNEQQSLRMLSTARIAGVLTDKNVGLFNIKKMGLKNIIPLKPALKSIPVFLVFSKQHRDSGLVEQFNQALAKMKAEGTYQKIFNKYRTNKD